MPGIVVFKRRWTAGSDDFVVPAAILVFLHFSGMVALALTYSLVDFKPSSTCTIGLVNIRYHILGYLTLMVAAVFLEIIVFTVSLRGTILEVDPRASMQYLLYTRLFLFLLELSWQVVGVVWLSMYYRSCDADTPKKVVLCIIVCNLCFMLIIAISVWCTYDSAGRKWVKMKRYQESLKGKQKKRHSGRRNWRQRSSLVRLISSYKSIRRKAIRAYEESWDRRFNFLCCCVDTNNGNRNSITEIAKLFTEFFRDLDVVPTDVVAGFVLLRRHQSIRMRHHISQGSNDVYKYLSGVPITPETEFLQLGQQDVLDEFLKVKHYMKFAMAAYGWPGYVMLNTATGLCQIIPALRCCCCQKTEMLNLMGDNCCMCNLVALLRISGLQEPDIIYATYHVDIGETPFYVAVDHQYQKVVICVRGTTSLQDVLTDLKADAETLPLDPVREEWLGHKGMVQAAVYIKNKLKDDMILANAFGSDPEKGTPNYDLVLVGHSLGGGTVAILAILLQQEYPNLHCYSYSPPGGLLSEKCVDDTKHFITSVVLGKDIVPRIGLPQLEVLRTDLINVIKRSTESKWKIIMRALCCGNSDAHKMRLDDVRLEIERDIRAHPSDSGITLSAHTPLYPPGKIIHIVRSHPHGKGRSTCCKTREPPVYQAVWVNNKSFDEVLVSPTMINDHMPDNVMEALEQVLINVAPPKPTRTLTETERKALLEDRSPSSDLNELVEGPGKVLNNGSNNETPNTQLPRFLYESVTEEQVMSVNSDGSVVFSGSKKKPKLILDLESTDPIEAPLASPDTISDKSSLTGSVTQSSGGGSIRDSYRKSLQSPTLPSIQQSPEYQRSSYDTVNMEENSNCSNHVLHKEQKLYAIPNKSSILTQAIVESSPERNGHHPDAKEQILSTNNVSLEFHSEERNHSSHCSGENSHRHSPVEGNQLEYGHPNSYYTASGIGYPHGAGAYFPPIENVQLETDENVCSNQTFSDIIPQTLSKEQNCHMHKRSISDTQAKASVLLINSPSESQLPNLSEKFKMTRSREHGDIFHLQGPSEPYHLIPVHDVHCSGKSSCHPVPSVPITSDGMSKTESDSPEDNSERQLSSSHSDEVFDFPLQETDV